MSTYKVLKSREEWLKERGNRIGGSDAACLIGLNPWKSNVQLFREKMHPESVEEVDNPAMEFGRNSEPHIRALFELSHPDIEWYYEENNIWLSDDYPFAHASLDGWGIKGGSLGILEIKTTTIRSRIQARDWDNRIPNNYYCQVLWYMMVTGAEWAVVVALLKRLDGVQEIRPYHIVRTAKEDEEIEMLAEAGRRFWTDMQENHEPALILPTV